MAPPLPPPMPGNGRFVTGPGPKGPPPHIMTLLNIVNTLTHFLLGGVASVAIVFANQFPLSSASFTQHIKLCVVGYIILMSQAVLSISPFNGWSSTFNHQERRNIHWVMQVIGSALAIAGSIIRISELTNHFQSTHAALGFIAFLFTCLSLIGGVVNLCSNNTLNTKFLQIGHACFGSITLTLAFMALIFGFNHNVFRLLTDMNANMMIAFTAFALLGTLLSACLNVFTRF